MNTDPVNEKYTGQKPTKEVLGNKIKGYFIPNKYIYWCKQAVTPNWNLCHNLTKSCEKKNTYVQFVYVPQTICNHTWWQLSESMNADIINANKQVKTNDILIKTKTPK